MLPMRWVENRKRPWIEGWYWSGLDRALAFAFRVKLSIHVVGRMIAWRTRGLFLFGVVVVR